MTSSQLNITENAARKIAALCAAKGNSALMLRVTVLGGGCSGFQYQLDLDNQMHEGDLTFEKNGVKVVTDETSMPFLQNAEVDYVEEMVGAAFKIKNPNATASCSCGTSFTV